MTPYVNDQRQQRQQMGQSGAAGGVRGAVTNPYNRTAGGIANGGNQNQNLRQPPANPYATSNGGTGGGGPTGSTASSRPMNSIQRQHPHRGGRVRADRRFTTALEIFSGGPEDDADGPDRSAGPPPASMTSSASV